MARHLQLAAAARDTGDLAVAADHEEVLVLVAPEDARHRKALDTTRDAIRRGVREHGQAGSIARRHGDLVAARDAFLRVLALDPDNADAVRALREIELQAMSRAQAERAARVRASEEVISNARTRAAATTETYDLDQRLELVRAGDINAGVRELRAWAEANPNDRTGRQRAGAAVTERARDVEGKGQREAALALYEQAASIAGGSSSEASARIQALKKALGEHYYGEGMRIYRTDIAAAIRHFEKAAKYDASNTNAQSRLREAQLAQQKLRKIGAK